MGDPDLGTNLAVTSQNNSPSLLSSAPSPPSSSSSYLDVLHLVYGELRKINKSKQQLVSANCGLFFFILFAVAAIQSSIQSNLLFCCAGGVGTFAGVGLLVMSSCHPSRALSPLLSPTSHSDLTQISLISIYLPPLISLSLSRKQPSHTLSVPPPISFVR